MAYGLFLLKPELFFPAMMATIGCRYFVFASVYGRVIFWVFGVTLMVCAFLAFALMLLPAMAAALGSLIEILFAILVFVKASKTTHT